MSITVKMDVLLKQQYDWAEHDNMNNQILYSEFTIGVANKSVPL